MSIDIERIQELIELLEGTDVTRLCFQGEGFEIEIERTAAGVLMPVGVAGESEPTLPRLPAQAPALVAAAPGAASPFAAPVAAAAESDANIAKVTSPFVGTFYRASAPGTPPFTEVGARVKKGDSLCIVEAMKLMNEIESEVAGVVRAILVNNEDPVEFGQDLFEIETSG